MMIIVIVIIIITGVTVEQMMMLAILWLYSSFRLLLPFATPFKSLVSPCQVAASAMKLLTHSIT